MNATASVLEEIALERSFQDERWGPQNHEPGFWLAILTEEVGEVARELCEAGNNGTELSNNLRLELLQVAAVAVAWAETL